MSATASGVSIPGEGKRRADDEGVTDTPVGAASEPSPRGDRVEQRKRRKQVDAPCPADHLGRTLRNKSSQDQEHADGAANGDVEVEVTTDANAEADTPPLPMWEAHEPDAKCAIEHVSAAIAEPKGEEEVIDAIDAKDADGNGEVGAESEVDGIEDGCLLAPQGKQIATEANAGIEDGADQVGEDGEGGRAFHPEMVEGACEDQEAANRMLGRARRSNRAATAPSILGRDDNWGSGVARAWTSGFAAEGGDALAGEAAQGGVVAAGAAAGGHASTATMLPPDRTDEEAGASCCGSGLRESGVGRRLRPQEEGSRKWGVGKWGVGSGE